MRVLRAKRFEWQHSGNSTKAEDFLVENDIEEVDVYSVVTEMVQNSNTQSTAFCAITVYYWVEKESL